MNTFPQITSSETASIRLVFAADFHSDKNVREHAHVCTELIFIKQGRCTVHTGQQTLHAGPGDIITMPAHQVHDQISEGYVETLFCGFNSTLPINISEPHVTPLPDTAFIETCLSLLVSIHLSQIQAAPDAADTVLSAILKQLRQQHVLRQEMERIPPLLRTIIRYIDEHLDQPILIQSLAEQMHMSVSSLQLLFRTHLNTSPLQYLQNQRMQAAKTALQTPYLSVKEVAAICGYPDINYFVRAFRKTHGLPPGQWRQHHHGIAM